MTEQLQGAVSQFVTVLAYAVVTLVILAYAVVFLVRRRR